LRGLGGDLDVVLFQQVAELRVLQSDWVAGAEARAVAELSGDAAVRADRDGRDLSGGDVALEL
jgi:hypothetical protein